VKSRNSHTLIVACVFALSSSVLAQSGNSDRCEVGIANLKTQKSVMLGTFKTVIAEEELTTKAFRLPQSNLFIVASVFYTDESLASEKGADSISLELVLSSSRKRNVLRSRGWAEAELPLNGFDVGRVTMMIKARDHPELVVMECRKDVRR
jgi:hypothetical protein